MNDDTDRWLLKTVGKSYLVGQDISTTWTPEPISKGSLIKVLAVDSADRGILQVLVKSANQPDRVTTIRGLHAVHTITPVVTVADFIAFLQQQNPSAVVLTQMYSDYTALDLPSIQVSYKHDFKCVIHHNERFLCGELGWHRTEGDQVEPIEAIILPGN